MAFHVPDKYRVREGLYGSDDTLGNYGAFQIRLNSSSCLARVIASEGGGWEHVSVSFPNRCPSWEEMCEIKAIFWDNEDAVIQIHPKESEYIRTHPYALHLWRCMDGREQPLPPPEFVGVVSRK